MQILLLGYSSGTPSQIGSILEIVAEMLKERGAAPYLWDLRLDPIPLFDPCEKQRRSGTDALSRFSRLSEEADAFVWASPNYHNSFAGVLKNALDSLCQQQCRHKPVALISSGASERNNTQPCDQLRIVARGLHAIAIPSQVATIQADFAHEYGRYLLTNGEIRARIVCLVDELLLFTQAFSSVLRASPCSTPS